MKDKKRRRGSTSAGPKLRAQRSKQRSALNAGSVLNINERKEAEQAKNLLIEDLNRSQQYFRALFNRTPSAVGISTVAEDRLCDVNEGFSRLTGYTREELLGRTTLEVGLWADSSERATVLREIQEQGSLHNREGLLRTKSGEIRSLMVTVDSIQLGSTPCLIYVAHDITERKRAEEALKQSEERFGSFVRSTDDGIVTLDRLGLILFWNPGAEKLFGYAQDEVLGKPMTLLMPERFRERHERGIERASAAGHLTGAGNMFELVGLRKDGTEFPNEISLSSWSTRNGVFFTGIVRDITERKKAEAQLQETLIRLHNLSHRLDVVREEERTRIARELHDELGVRLTCLKMDLARVPSLVPRHRMEEKVRAMTAEVDRTIASVQRLVAELRPGILDDLGLVAAIEWQCRDFERRSGIRCLCEAARAEIPLDRSRTTAAFRVCQEALTNVLRHAEATAVNVRLDQRDGRLRLEIHDNGRGIAPDKWSDSQSFGLMGMRERAGAVGGQVHIIGESGVGTTVTLDLPMANS